MEALKSRLRQKKTMSRRFRLPLTQEEATELLLIAVQNEVEFRQRHFIMSDDLMEQVTKMASWLTGESSKFGIMLLGSCGNGKSTLVKAFDKLLTQLAIPLYRNCTIERYDLRMVDAKYVANLSKSNPKDFVSLTRAEMLAIDDLGTEPIEVMDYGNISYPLIDLLTQRYELQQFTIITTNLTGQAIREKYGDRIADRLNEMMEKVGFTNPSYRTD